MVQFGESNSVTRQVNFNWSKLVDNAKINKLKRDILGDFQTLWSGLDDAFHLLIFWVLVIFIWIRAEETPKEETYSRNYTQRTLWWTINGPKTQIPNLAYLTPSRSKRGLKSVTHWLPESRFWLWFLAFSQPDFLGTGWSLMIMIMLIMPSSIVTLWQQMHVDVCGSLELNWKANWTTFRE